MPKRIEGPVLLVDPKGPTVDIGRGTLVQARFTARYVVARFGAVELDIESTDWRIDGSGRSRIVAARFDEDEGRGLDFDLRGVGAKDLMARAVSQLSFISPSLADAPTRSAEARKATRRKPDKHRLQQVADAYRRDGTSAVVELGMTDRHARRLVAKAREAGILGAEERR